MKQYWLRPEYQPPAGASHEEIAALSAVDVEQAYLRLSLDVWTESERRADGSDDRMMELLERMHVLFDYLYCCPDATAVAVRVWVMLYLVRPDVIGYESMNSAAARYGVTLSYVQTQVLRFRSSFPGVRLAGRPKGGSQSELRERRRKGYRRQRGVESLTLERYEAEKTALLSA